MAWYRNGTVTVTNGSAVVTGANTDFIANTQIGEVFLGPDGRVYEIAGVQSATQLTIIPIYQGGTAGAQGYGIQPTSSFARDLALGVSQLLNTFGAVRDGIGQGLFLDGSQATPAFRFAADQDTGFRRSGTNELSLVAGGVDALTVGASGVRFGRPIVSDLQFLSAGPRAIRIESTSVGASDVQLQIATPDRAWHIGQNVSGSGVGTLNFFDVTGGSCRMKIDQSGNLLVGAFSGSSHRFVKGGVAAGAEIVTVDNGVYGAVSICAGDDGPMGGAAPAVMKLTRIGSTQRSISAGGTINASGADYAEYMTKADGCGLIAKGDVCGVDVDGKLTKTWAVAKSFVVKSTDPAYVGGDSWSAHLPAKPDGPGAAPVAPLEPGPEPDDPATLADWTAASAAYPGLLREWMKDANAWEEATAAYDADLAAWNVELEAARQSVDRIAFAGQVPVNVAGEFAVGDYLIAAAHGGGIQAVAVAEADITFDQYRRRLGKIWAIRDGRPWVDVQHG